MEQLKTVAVLFYCEVYHFLSDTHAVAWERPPSVHLLEQCPVRDGQETFPDISLVFCFGTFQVPAHVTVERHLHPVELFLHVLHHLHGVECPWLVQALHPPQVPSRFRWNVLLKWDTCSGNYRDRFLFGFLEAYVGDFRLLVGLFHIVICQQTRVTVSTTHMRHKFLTTRRGGVHRCGNYRRSSCYKLLFHFSL
jgi:hypothetical protein